MQTKTKQRLVGLLILLAILAIFLPLVFHNSRPSTELQAVRIPPKPTLDPIKETQEKEQVALLPRVSEASVVTSSLPTPNAHRSEVQSPVQSNAQATLTRNAIESSEAEHAFAKQPLTNVKPIEKPVASKVHLKKDKERAILAQKGLRKFMQAPRAWSVQLGTFANHENADKLIHILREKGFDAYTRPIASAGGAHLLRVYVGPEIRKNSALQLRDRLEASVHLKGVVKKYSIKT